ncbi:hypothetical protein GCM10012275_21600 [Longimycelium tulufanense]|uniref:MFS transporter n=1 Tax=Longimycelium tulufanense TaxID=907463 RepID=A0A8J3CAE6_9PSEU|nr:hypothetical protein GCM10012275_21600 [Longimycelium tulufanense]
MFLAQDRQLNESAAAGGYACFSVAMVVARLLGERLERRFGPYRLLAGGGGGCAVGLAVTVIIPLPVAGYLGLVLAGLGVAAAFPVVLGLAGAVGAETGRGGEREIGFVTMISYAGFLIGPPMVGVIAQRTSLAVALGAVAAVVALVVPMAWTVARARRNAPKAAVSAV